jgi:hypothetical protein
MMKTIFGTNNFWSLGGGFCLLLVLFGHHQAPVAAEVNDFNKALSAVLSDMNADGVFQDLW